MPQPIIKSCYIDFTGIGSRPEHAAVLGEIVSTSGRLEGHLGWLLAFLSQASAEITIAMFHATTSTDAQRAMLLAAAELALKGPDKDLFDELMEDFRVRYKERSKLVHNLWGVSSQHPDKAIWCKASDAATFFARLAASTTLEQVADAQGAGLWVRCMTYTVKDLKDVSARLTEYTSRVSAFLDHLIDCHPAVAAHLANDRKDAEQTTELPQESPQTPQIAQE